jgi:TolB protein
VLSTFDNYNHGRNFRYDLWAVDLSSLQTSKLSSDGIFANYLAGHLHPQGNQFVYGSWEPLDTDSSIIAAPTNLFLVNINPFAISQITETGRNSYPQFSPDGTKIVYVAESNSGEWDVYTLNPDGSGVERLTETGHRKLTPQWSPDGRRIAFIKAVGEGHSIWVMNSDGRNLKRLTR